MAALMIMVFLKSEAKEEQRKIVREYEDMEKALLVSETASA